LKFFNYKLNREILFAFFLIIIIPGVCSFWVNYHTLNNTMRLSTEDRLREGVSVYYEEFKTIKEKCLTIASSYSKKEFIKDRLINGDTVGFEDEIIDFYEMNLVDIIEIEDHSGKVIFRGHNPELAGDIKSDQWVIQEGLYGKTNVSFEYGRSGFAIRAVAPINHEGEIIGLFMTGELFSGEFVEKLKTMTLLDNGIYRENKKIVATFDGLDLLDSESLSLLIQGESVLLKDERINSELYTIILEPIFLRDQYWGAVCLGISNTHSQRLYNYSNKQITYIVLIGFFCKDNNRYIKL